MRSLNLVLFIVFLAVIIGCSTQIDGITASEENPLEWLFGEWLQRQPREMRITFTPDCSLVITGYGVKDGLYVEGKCAIWSDRKHFRLDIAQSTDPVNFPRGRHSGMLVYNSENDGRIWMSLRYGDEFPESYLNSDISLDLRTVEEYDEPLIITDFSVFGERVPFNLDWSTGEEVTGFNVYRCFEGTTRWRKVNSIPLPADTRTFIDDCFNGVELTYDSLFDYFSPNLLYYLEAVTEDSLRTYYSTPRAAVFFDIGDRYHELTTSVHRTGYDRIEIRWDKTFEELYENPYLWPDLGGELLNEVTGYRIYRFFDNPFLDVSRWELVYDTETMGPPETAGDEYSYTESIEWGNHSAVFYSVAWVFKHMYREPFHAEYTRLYYESPHYSNVNVVLRK